MVAQEEKSMLKNDSETLKQYIATCCVAVGAVCAGTVLAWTSPVLPQIQMPKNASNITVDDGKLQLTETQCGMVGSMLALGALLSSIPAGFVAEKFGRKYTLLSLSVPYTLNWILIVFANNAATIYAARFFAGLATGAICVCAPMFIGEIAQPSIRGKLGSFFQMFLCCGILATYIVGALVDWKVLSIILGCVPILFVVCVFMVPETPVYLVKIGERDRAVESLKFYRGENYNYYSELDDLREAAREASEKNAKLSDIVVSKANRKALVSALGIMAFQQLSGINAVIFYSESIFKSAGSSLSSDLSTILVGVLQVVAAYIAAMVIEKANRKLFLMFSSVGMGICLAALAMSFHFQNAGVTSSLLNIIPIGSLLLFIVSFSFGFGPVPWMVMSELFAPEIKGIASGLAVMTNWIFVFIVTFAFPIMNSSLGGHTTFYIFTGLMGLATAFVYFVMPETRGKTLQEIQQLLNR